jgi:hypothetical protein
VLKVEILELGAQSLQLLQERLEAFVLDTNLMLDPDLQRRTLRMVVRLQQV